MYKLLCIVCKLIIVLYIIELSKLSYVLVAKFELSIISFICKYKLVIVFLKVYKELILFDAMNKEVKSPFPFKQ